MQNIDNNFKEINMNRRIVTVDDKPYNHLALKIIIQQAGFENILQLIDKANNGQ
jgi:hypothetical protein